jgi:hypothetical protein
LYERWGLLPAERDGRWPPETVDRLVRIRDEAAVARLLPRRVVRLRNDYREFPVPAACLREAFVEMAPTIPRPVRKMARIDEALRAFAARSQGRAPSRRRAPLPAPADWVYLFEELPLAHWESRPTGWYFFAGRVLPDAVRDSTADLDGMPLEERVVLYALIDITRPGGSPPARSPGEP